MHLYDDQQECVGLPQNIHARYDEELEFKHLNANVFQYDEKGQLSLELVSN